ncbi:surface antigen-like protein [Mucilaginibacter frigoritolerans]|uniref:Surface antigen-like protein n=1 Tax=Mucilaginibacter frigoritolerans TaxID=652788 RepID=A0A562U781_9SPHI|nr:BamA/TamA family outer membrane protein [Mucilaginibacter frigoritolerans]TWJ01614.1 surface antigen-like protein [Mucilaginibacter frigoritolerans]
MKTPIYLLILIAILYSTRASCRQDPPVLLQPSAPYGSRSAIADSGGQRDMIDIVERFFDKNSSPNKKEAAQKASFSVVPYGGYTLSTGLTIDITGNVGFYTGSDHHENFSVIAADLGYDSESQKTFLTRSEIWLPGNNYKLVSDLRWEKYPTDTYGLGTFTTFATDNPIDFYYLRVYETVLRKLGNDYYAGIGYNLDNHYNITQEGNQNGTVSDFTKYGQTRESTSSGINLDFLFDSRKNQLNPLVGSYLSVIYRQNLTVLGSNANWEELQLDARKYIRLSPSSNNVLALWGMAAFTTGNVPYLDLPSTGGDMYNNSGRGYAVGRFRGRDMLYMEGEYRFGITRNGLLGAVIFANAESFTEYPSNTFQKIAPATGTGLRLKLNKYSNTNICIDYGVGVGGSHGFFVNLGELF